jgi:2Fe-2S ferredoxin
MPKINFIDSEGEHHEVEAENGATLMETAMQNGVPGIIASCGGGCACATCHVYVDEAWLDKTGERSAEEDDMLYSAIDVAPNSRLSCQIVVSKDLDGLVVRIAERQI